MAVGKKLEEIIKHRGLTQKEVADRAGIKPQTLNNLITRDSARADVQILLKICKALEIDMSVFEEDAIKEFYEDHPRAEKAEEKSAPAENGESEKIKKIKEIMEKASRLGDSDVIQLDNFVDFLLTQTKVDTEE